MKKNPVKSKNTGSSKTSFIPKNFVLLLLLLAYGFVTLLTPNFNALDPNGPKFLGLAILNILTFIILLVNKEIKSHSEWYYAIFRTGMGIAYLGLMVVSLLSFVNAINILESILHFAKISTTFSAAYLISVIVIADKRNIVFLCIAMTALLIYQGISVFAELGKYIHEEVRSIMEIKPGFTNKNILAASIFIKIPFAIWLMVFQRRWLSYLGILGVFASLLATLILSTRAFYLGLIALSVVLILYFLIRYIKTRQISNIKNLSIWVILLFSVFLTFWILQTYAYPSTKEAQERTIEARLSAISAEGGRGRFEIWKSSWKIFKQSPLTGVGLGNWKIVTLKEENETSKNLILRYKAHNDFVEITTETGIFGGLFFAAIFLFIWLTFLKALFKKSKEEWLPWVFLPAAGLFCYFFDAFFNFPQDRPEIQSLFVLYVGMGIAFSAMFAKDKSEVETEDSGYEYSGEKKFLRSLRIRFSKKKNEEERDKQFSEILILVFGMLMIASIYFLYLNFKSLQLQRIGKLEEGVYSSPSSLFLKGYPFIPSLDAHGEPIAINKARYLLKEGQYDKLIEIVKRDHSSPYDGRREFMLAAAYAKLNMADSAIAYAQKSYEMKPNYYNFVLLYCDLLKIKGDQEKVEAIMNNYLENNKYNKEAWVYAAKYQYKLGNIQQASALIDSGNLYIENDTLLLNEQQFLKNKISVETNQELFNAASEAQNKGQFSEAVSYYTSLIENVPDSFDALFNRAKCYHGLKEYQKSIQDLNKAIIFGKANGVIYNLQGANYFFLGNKDEACRYFKMASDLGDKDGINNYSKICQ